MLGLSRNLFTLASRRRGPAVMPAHAIYDFGAGTLPPGITFARNGPAFYPLSNGSLALAAIDEPRFAPASGAGIGLLVEPAATNILPASAHFGSSSWRKNGSSVETNVSVAPDGSISADNLVENTDDSRHDVEYNFGAGDAGAAYSASVFAKAGLRDVVRLRCGRVDVAESLRINLTTGAISHVGANITQASATAFANGWWHICLSTTLEQTSAAQYLQIRPLDDQGNISYPGGGQPSLTLWGAQLETGPTASSYIATAGGAASRVADQIGINNQSGVFDVQIEWGSGQVGQLAAQTLTPGWWPDMTENIIRRIALFAAGTF